MTDNQKIKAKSVVDSVVTVLTAAGNNGKQAGDSNVQYGGITAPGNAPWVLRVGGY